jgi:hypothetical protein
MQTARSKSKRRPCHRAAGRVGAALAWLAPGALAVSAVTAQQAGSGQAATAAESSPPPAAGRPQQGISLYYAYAIRDHHLTGPFTSNKVHPLLDGVILNVN